MNLKERISKIEKRTFPGNFGALEILIMDAANFCLYGGERLHKDKLPKISGVRLFISRPKTAGGTRG